MVYRYSRQEKYEETQQDHITLRSEVQLLTLKTKQESDTEHYRCLTSRTHSVTKHNLPWSALKTGTLIKTSTQCRNRFLRGKAAELAFTHGKQRQAFSAGWMYTAWLFCQSITTSCSATETLLLKTNHTAQRLEKSAKGQLTGTKNSRWWTSAAVT